MSTFFNYRPETKAVTTGGFSDPSNYRGAKRLLDPTLAARLSQFRRQLKRETNPINRASYQAEIKNIITPVLGREPVYRDITVSVDDVLARLDQVLASYTSETGRLLTDGPTRSSMQSTNTAGVEPEALSACLYALAGPRPRT